MDVLYFSKEHLWWVLLMRQHWKILQENACYHYNTWVTGVYLAYMFDRKSGEKTSQIECLFE